MKKLLFTAVLIMVILGGINVVKAYKEQTVTDEKLIQYYGEVCDHDCDKIELVESDDNGIYFMTYKNGKQSIYGKIDREYLTNLYLSE